MTVRPNVLLIIADDLNAWIGALGRQPDVRTPHLDALAKRGSLFTRAYCAAPYCNASRMSLFTGLLPSSTGVYGNDVFWDRPDRPQTMFDVFKSAGYTTYGAGKVFHGVFDYASAGRQSSRQALWREIENRAHQWDGFVPCSSEPMPPDRPLNGLFDFGEFEKVPPYYHHFDWGVLPPDDEAAMPDERTITAISEFLSQPQAPFLCSVGLYKPHLPWYAPARFFDLYDPAQLSLPLVRLDDLDDVPDIARKWALDPPDHELVVRTETWRPAVRAYLACISYCDWMVGRVLSALEASDHADDTWIVFCGDNGFHLGEKLHWRKFTLWEEATRVPLIIVPPRGQDGVARVDSPVSLMDVAPTLMEACGLSFSHQTDGLSLAAMMMGHQRAEPALSTWGRGNHSVRSGQWRLTRYADGAVELYDHVSDPNEWTNLAPDARFAEILGRLSAAIPQGV